MLLTSDIAFEAPADAASIKFTSDLSYIRHIILQNYNGHFAIVSRSEITVGSSLFQKGPETDVSW